VGQTAGPTSGFSREDIALRADGTATISEYEGTMRSDTGTWISSSDGIAIDFVSFCDRQGSVGGKQRADQRAEADLDGAVSVKVDPVAKSALGSHLAEPKTDYGAFRVLGADRLKQQPDQADDKSVSHIELRRREALRGFATR
jgi:hypothetical protein